MARPLPFALTNYTSGYALRPHLENGKWAASVQNATAAELHRTAPFDTKEEALAAARSWLEEFRVRQNRTPPVPKE